MQLHELYPPVKLYNQRAHNLDDAAYIIRQHALMCGSLEEWKLGRKLRDADSFIECESLELRLRAWAQRTLQPWRDK
jgi:hypothetical protein